MSRKAKKMSKKHGRPSFLNKRRLSVFLFMAILGIQLVAATYIPFVQIAHAQSSGSVPSEAVLNNYEVAKQLLAQIQIAEKVGPVDFFASDLLVATYDKNSDYNLNNSSKQKISVSPSVAVKFAASDRKLEVGKVINTVLKHNYDNGAKAWLDKIYATNSSPKEPVFPRTGKWFPRYSGVNTGSLLKSELSKYIAEIETRPQFDKAWAAYTRRQVKAAFGVCYRLRDGKDPSKADSYDYNPGFNEGRGVDAGYVVETAIGEQNGTYQDGRVSCGTLMQGYLLGKYYDDTTSEDFEKDVKAQAIRDILTKDSESQSKFWYCVGASAPALTNLQLPDVLTAVSEWLAVGDDSVGTVVVSGSLPIPVSATVMKAIRDCLVAPDAFGEKLQKILDDDFISGDQDEEDASNTADGTTAELEDCSDKGLGWNPGNWLNNGLDWLGCQVAKAALSILKSASDWLATNLETTATTSSGDQSSKADEALKSVWSNILVVGNILFVVGFLIMILSTILNFSFVDAYTVKKFLPRIIIAVFLANASWFIVSQAISITNMLAGAAHEIIMSPLKNVADANIKDAFSGSVGASLIGLITAGAIPAIGAVASGGIFVFVPAVLGLLFAALTAIIIIVLRKVIIFALIVFAPLAIALWAIPGLDKWAGRWWKLLIEMLMVYPFIMAMFAIGEFAAMLTLMTNGSDSSNPVPGLMAIAFLCVPLFMLPTVFKLASSTLGNITGMVNNKSKGLIDRSKKSRNQKIAQGWDRKYAPRVLQTRANAAGWLMGKSSEGKRGARFLANRIGGYNIEADMSARNLQDGKVINAQIDTGRDGEIRGLTVNRAAAKAQMEAAMRADNNATGGGDSDLWRKNGDKIQYKSLGGEWIDSAEVEQGHKRWGNNQFAKQAALAYEIRKADTSEKVNGIKSRYADLATKEWGLSKRQAGGNWKGATFEHQNTHLALKHTNWENGTTDVSKLATELYEKRGAYPASNMVAQTFEELGKGYDTADADTQRNIRGIAETFVSRGRPLGQMGGMDEDQFRAQQQQQQQQAAAGGVGQTEAQVYASGAAHTNQAINKLARQVGVLDAPPSGNAGVRGGPVVDGDSPQKENGPI